MRCPQCGNYNFDSKGRCLFCGFRRELAPKPPLGWGDKDFSGPHNEHAEVKETKPTEYPAHPRLQECPQCKQKSLFWNNNFGVYECLNRDCQKKFAEDELPKQKGQESELQTTGEVNVTSSVDMAIEPGFTAQDARGGEEVQEGVKDEFVEHYERMGGKWKVGKGETFPFRKVLLGLSIFTIVSGIVIVCIVVLSSSSSATLRAPSNFAVTAGNMQDTLSWSNKDNSDQVLIRYKTTGYSTTTTDGTLLYEGNETSYTHTNLEYSKTYYYGIWSAKVVKGGWEYSDKGAFASGTPYWRGPDGEGIQEYAESNGAMVVGADGHYIELLNNPKAKNPTWQELKQFLWQDGTDQYLYNEASFVCADFAEMLHNNAEKAGIRSAYVTLDFSNDPDSHAINAFNTTDKGLIYIDDTGTEEGTLNLDKTVNIVVGQGYTPVSIFPNPGYPDTWDSWGTVAHFSIQW
jgi:hypothetical protein